MPNAKVGAAKDEQQTLVSRTGCDHSAEDQDKAWTVQQRIWDGYKFAAVPVLCPERLEVHCEADGATAVHLRSLSIQRWYLDLGSCGGVCCWDVKLEVKLVLDQLVDVPALPGPVRAFLVGCDGEPIRVCTLLYLYVLDESLQLLHSEMSTAVSLGPNRNK